jgi:hypothetical protein
VPYSPISLYHSTRVPICAIAIPIPYKCRINVSFGSCFVSASAIFSVLSICYTTILLRNTISSRINISLILICFALLCDFQVLASSSAAALSIIKGRKINIPRLLEEKIYIPRVSYQRL